jgi:putative phosphoesterase
MRVGIFADVHDHLDHLRRAVEQFNKEQVELVPFAGDLVSTISVPPLRKLQSPLVGCFGDNEGNKLGLLAGIRVVGQLYDPPVLLTTPDGARLVVTHMKSQLRDIKLEYDIAIFGHTHKSRIERDDAGRLYINPGETSGWSFGRPTIGIPETTTRQVNIVDLA